MGSLDTAKQSIGYTECPCGEVGTWGQLGALFTTQIRNADINCSPEM